MEKKMTSIGGQAVIEGVMMRGPHKIAVAVRKPNGEIVIDEKPTPKVGKIVKVPIIRGVYSFFSSLVIGIQALTFSVKFFDDEELGNDKKKVQKVENGKGSEKTKSNDAKTKNIKSKNIKSKMNDKKNDFENEGALSDSMIYISVILSLFLSVGLFIILPNLVTNFVVPNKEEHAVLYNFIESVVKLIIFGGYIALISQMKDIQRVFEYHGAEHKTIFCYENGEELTVENVKKYTRFHPRCGTSFLLFVMIVSILVFSLLGVYENALINIGLRLLFLPVVAGLSYEIIKFAGKSKNKCVTWLNAPGKWLQKFTTREPDDSQIEVAIRSMKAVIPENGDDDLW